MSFHIFSGIKLGKDTMKGETMKERMKAMLAAIATIGAILLTTCGAWADTLYVDAAKGVDAPDYGYAKETPVKTIQRAIGMASNGDVIIVYPGTYGAINASNYTNLQIRSSAGAGKTIIDGKNTSRCVLLADTVGLVIDGFTIMNGNASEQEYGANYNSSRRGGGVCYGVVKNCIVKNNHASYDGGGLYGCDVYSTTISDNTSDEEGGGVARCYVVGCKIYGNSAYGGGGTRDSHVYDSVVSNNFASTSSGLGGGIYNYGDWITSNCVICLNTAFAGGGVFAYGGKYYDCDIYGNEAVAESSKSYSMTCGGGGVSGSNWNGGRSYGTFYNCDIHDNKAVRGGGALFARLYECTVRDNHAQFGGGGYSLWAFNSLIAGNTAERNGGGVLGGGLYNCTVSANAAGDCGGGVYTTEDSRNDDRFSVAAYNSIVYGNTAVTNGADGYLGYWYNSCVGYLQDDLETIKQSVIFKNPKFVDAAKGDYRLSADSPCIDKGDNGNVETETDYAGMERIFNGTVDMGAYEYGAGAKKYTVTFVLTDSYSATLDETSREVEKGKAVGTLPNVTVTDDGYYYDDGVLYRWTFIGWFTAGGEQITAGTVITSDVKFYTRFDYVEITGTSYMVTFNANGGSVSEAKRTVASGALVGALPEANRSGYTFLGWFTAASGGTQVAASAKVTANVTYYAHWSQNGGTTSGGTPVVYNLYTIIMGTVPDSSASVYDAYLYDALGAVVGTVTVKVGKPKNGSAKVTATVLVAGGKKTSLKGTLDVASGEVSGLDLMLGANGVAGTIGGYSVEGARNMFTSKVSGESAAANVTLAKWLGGPACVAWKGSNGWSGLSVKLGKKGKAKIAGALADGTKVSAKSQLVVGEEWSCVPIVCAKKSVRLAFLLWLKNDGTLVAVEGLGADAVAAGAGALRNGAKFALDGDLPTTINGAATLAGLLPKESVTVAGAKWSVVKSGKVAYKDGTVTYGGNPSGLKLSYKAKDGTFKGSFSVYTFDEKKLKKVKATVTGILVNGQGYGTATIKKVGSAPVTIK